MKLRAESNGADMEVSRGESIEDPYMDKSLTSREVKCFVEWLEIPAGECPPHHYRLLDLPLFESDAAAIRAAVQKRIHRVMSVAGPEDRQDSGRLQSYLLKVETGLLDANAKALYDTELRDKYGLMRSDQRHAVAAPHIVPAVVEAASAVPTVNHTNGSPVVTRLGEPLPVSPVASSAPDSRKSIWPWVAGLMTLNTLVLALIVGFILMRVPGGTSPSNVPGPAQPHHTPDSSLVDGNHEDRGGTKPPSVPALVKPVGEPPLGPASAKVAVAPNPAPEKTPSKPRKPTNPFAKSLPAVQIPDVPAQGAEIHSVELAALPSELPDKLTLQLDNAAAGFDTAMYFGLQEEEKPATAAQSWNVVVLEGDQESVYAEVPSGTTYRVIARLFLDEKYRLRFMWLPNAIDVVGSAQMANVVLIMSVGQWRHALALREPGQVERAKTHLIDEKLKFPLGDLGPLPNLDRVELEVKRVEGLDLPIAVEPFERRKRQGTGGTTILGDLLISVGPEKELTLPIQLVRDEEGELSFEMRPKYAQPDKQMRKLTDDELGDQIRIVQRNSVEWLDKYVSAINQIPEVERRIVHWQGVWNAMMQAKNASAAKAAGEVRQAEGERNKLLGTIIAARKQIPKTYVALAHYYRIVHIASALHASGGIEYRLCARCRDRDIDLVIGAGVIKVPTPAFIEIVNPGLPGTWIRTDGDMAYEFDAGGGLTVHLATALQQPMQGRWTRQGQVVEVKAGGGGETYTLHEDVLMTGPTGKLFKQVQLQ